MSGSNPLAAQQIMRPTPDHPAMTHAKAWQHVNSMSPDDMPDKATQMDKLLPIFAKLAGNPNVKMKDVIRAAADAAAHGIAKPSEAVAFISQMPSDPEKLQPWLKGIYETNLSALVHMKASMLQQAQGAPQPAPQAQPAMPGPLSPSPQGMLR